MKTRGLGVPLAAVKYKSLCLINDIHAKIAWKKKYKDVFWPATELILPL